MCRKISRNKLISIFVSLVMVILLFDIHTPKVEAAEKVSLVKSSGSVVIGGTQTIKLKNVAKGANITYKSNKTSVAKVSKKGKVRGIKAGTAKITVTVKKGNKKTSLFYKLTVKKPKISKSSISINTKKSIMLSIKNLPAKSANVKYTWLSENKKVATVKNGKVKGVAAGTTNIKVKITSGKKFSYTLKCKVKVKEVDATYNVFFDTNGGSYIASQMVKKNQQVNRPTDPLKNGYEFVGWYSDEFLSKPYNFYSTVTENVTIYAKWNKLPEDTEIIVFDTNGGSYISYQMVKEGNFVINPNTPVKDGYIFVGWYIDYALTRPYDFSTIVTESFVLYAKWEEIPIVTYNICFNSNGGSSVESQVVEEWQTVKKPIDPIKEGYIFEGWYTDFSLNSVYDFSTNVISNMILYAKWKPIPKETYIVSFESNGGSSVEFQIVEEGQIAMKPNAPIKEGYIFEGWYTDENFINEYNFDNVVISNMILYAKWIQEDINENGVPDSVEEGESSILDSDNDGLTDYFEYTLTNTDPYKIDTNNNGINDAFDDEDSDGLSNLHECEKETNPLQSDSDNDGLMDKEEEQYYTNPLNYDSDGDGASDGWEVCNYFEPLEFNSSFEIETIISSENITVGVNLVDDGVNVSNLKVSENKNNILLNENLPGYIGPGFDFTTSEQIDSATISFTFDTSLLLKEQFEPTIYYFNEESGILEELETTVNGNVASTVVSHFSTYILLNKSEFDEVWNEEIRKPNENLSSNGVSISFVLDRSSSMSWNDSNNLRNFLTVQFINKLSQEKDYGSVISFIANAEVLTNLTNDMNLLKDKVNSIIDDDGWGSNSGTNGSAGIHAALEQLIVDTSGNNRYIIFMTDGEDNRVSYSYDELIEIAKNNNVIIYTIGLGDVDNVILQKLADGTGGKYYYASQADYLLEAFEQAENETIDYHIDSNGDGISDYYTKLLCEEKLVSSTGIPIFKGHLYEEINGDIDGDFDDDGLKNGEEIVVTETNGKVYLTIKSSPELKDSDNDGIFDKEDTARLKKGKAGGIIGELTIISNYKNNQISNIEDIIKFDFGHAWLSYKSYINDEINIGNLLGGYVYNFETGKFEQGRKSIYKIEKDGHISIGNVNTVSKIETFLQFTGSCGGIYYNREYEVQLSGKKNYDSAVAYTREITSEQFGAMITYCNNNNFYNLYSHNCSTVASKAWEQAFGTGDGFYAKKNGNSYGISSKFDFDTPATLKKNILAKSGADFDYQSTMSLILEFWK